METNSNNENQKATLGCGSLILIALIVLIVSNGESDEIKDQLKEIESKIELQSQEIAELRRAVEKQLAKPEAAVPQE